MTRVDDDRGRLLDEAHASLREGAAEMRRLIDQLEAARAELASAEAVLAGEADRSASVPSVMAAVLPELRRGALLVDGDLWVIACNQAATEWTDVDPAAATPSSLALWPNAVALGRLVRTALASSPADPIEEAGAVAIALGAPEGAGPTERSVLVLLPGDPISDR